MSHIVEEYAKHLGVKIAKPIISKHFMPLKHEKFITISLEANVPSKNYKYYEIVIDMIRGYLNANGIKIIQMGSSQSPKLRNVDEMIFDIPFKNAAYVISKSKLHIGTDNVLSHCAGIVDTPVVTLFGHVFANVARSYWSKKAINIEAPWEVKPCFGADDPFDSINKIKPEIIANAIFKQLGVNVPASLKTRFIGDYYENTIVELVPDFFSEIAELQSQHVFIRMDYGFNNQAVNYWFNYLNQFSIFSNEIIPPTFLASAQNKIKSVSFIMGETYFPIEYLESVKSMGIGVVLLVKDEAALPNIREKFFDFDVHLYFKGKKESLGVDFKFNNTAFNSSKVILSKGKKFVSKYHWLKGENFVDKNFNFEDNEVLIEEINHFYIYDRGKS